MTIQKTPPTPQAKTLFGSLFAPFFTRRFVKFAGVGFSGIGVNLASLVILADVFQLHNNLASALAIQISIFSNFLFNEFWTFSDRRTNNGGFWRRGLRFNLVSLAGALIQWSVFVYANLAWALMTYSSADLLAYHGEVAGAFSRWVVHPIVAPPEVDSLKYVSQLLGIGVATFWNFLVNVRWTWAQMEADDDHSG